VYHRGYHAASTVLWQQDTQTTTLCAAPYGACNGERIESRIRYFIRAKNTTRWRSNMKRFVITEEQLEKYENGGYNDVILREIRSHPFSTEINKVLNELEDYCKDDSNVYCKDRPYGGYDDPTLDQQQMLDKINSMKPKEVKE
jgi:hypothetical protein